MPDIDASAPELQYATAEDDALASLEDRIHRAVDLVATLRAERDAALADLDSARKNANGVSAENQKLRQEVESLRSERKQVRTRIEKLLGQMELL
jgi:FtsZ-binding cell division protein ZapB